METGLSRKQRRWIGVIGGWFHAPGNLREHIRKCKAATDKPFGVNVPLMYPEIETLMEIIQEEGVKIVFTSAGNPKTWTSKLQQAGIKVLTWYLPAVSP